MLPPIHPFPARMAPEIIWSEIPSAKDAGRLTVLDPMAGSGTTIASARLLGHRAIGFDTDPLAITIARAWSMDIDSERFLDYAALVLANACAIARDLSVADAFPSHCDEDTRAFLRYWFEPAVRVQLMALCHSIEAVTPHRMRALMWCAFSRLIITKDAGVSLAMDVSHSRPHRAYDKAPYLPFDRFLRAATYIAARAPFSSHDHLPTASIRAGDARELNVDSASIHWVVTSPPYLNAIDYMRGHRLSLVWMGYDLASLRRVRSGNIGTESGSKDTVCSARLQQAIESMGETCRHSTRIAGMLRRYVGDMDRVISEIKRVLIPGGHAILVVGDSNVKNVFVSNSAAIASLGIAHGLSLLAIRSRELPANRRYLPPPRNTDSSSPLQARMRDEVVLKFWKPIAA